MTVTLNRNQVAQLLEMFGGEDCSITLEDVTERNGIHGPGLYAWATEYPENGSTKLDPDGFFTVFDTNEVEQAAFDLTGDEGEDDALTVLRGLARFVEGAWPGRNALAVLLDAQERDAGETPPAPVQPSDEQIRLLWADHGGWSHECPSAFARELLATYGVSRPAVHTECTQVLMDESSANDLSATSGGTR